MKKKHQDLLFRQSFPFKTFIKVKRYPLKMFGLKDQEQDIIKQIQTMETDDTVNLDFGSGIQLTGTLSKKLILEGKLLVASFLDCTITRGDRVLFDPSWGTFDLACGSIVASVSGGPADMQPYIKHMQMELPNKIKPDYLVHHSQKEENLIVSFL